MPTESSRRPVRLRDIIATPLQSNPVPASATLISFARGLRGVTSPNPNVKNVKPLESLKSFRLVYYQPPGTSNQNSCIVDNLLMEEFIFLGSDQK